MWKKYSLKYTLQEHSTQAIRYSWQTRSMNLIQSGTDIRLVIVDSLTAHFRAEYVGRESLANRQQKLNQHLHTLQILPIRIM